MLRPVGKKTVEETSTRAAGFPGFRRQRNVRAAHGVADVSSGSFLLCLCSLIIISNEHDYERSRRFPRSLSVRSISPAGRWLSCLCRAPRPTGFPYEAGTLRPPLIHHPPDHIRSVFTTRVCSARHRPYMYSRAEPTLRLALHRRRVRYRIL